MVWRSRPSALVLINCDVAPFTAMVMRPIDCGPRRASIRIRFALMQTEAMVMRATGGPEGLSFTDAAAIPLCFLTAWQMVVRKAQVRPGQTVLVQAAGSGVSSAAIQIAKMQGARVLTTTSTDEKAARARAVGADEVINCTTFDFVAECKRFTDKKGVDVVIEHVGGEVFVKSILVTARGDRVVTCGATSGFTPTVDLRHIFFRQLVLEYASGRVDFRCYVSLCARSIGRNCRRPLPARPAAR